MRRLREILSELMRESRVARARRRTVNQQLEEQRFEDRQARHKAGIYEPPSSGGF